MTHLVMLLIQGVAILTVQSTYVFVINIQGRRQVKNMVVANASHSVGLGLGVEPMVWSEIALKLRTFQLLDGE